MSKKYPENLDANKLEYGISELMKWTELLGKYLEIKATCHLPRVQESHLSKNNEPDIPK